MIQCNICGKAYKDEDKVTICDACGSVIPEIAMREYSDTYHIGIQLLGHLCEGLLALMSCACGCLMIIFPAKGLVYAIMALLVLVIAILQINQYKSYTYTIYATVAAGVLMFLFVGVVILAYASVDFNLGFFRIFPTVSWFEVIIPILDICYIINLLLYRKLLEGSYKRYYMEHNHVSEEQYKKIRPIILDVKHGNKKKYKSGISILSYVLVIIFAVLFAIGEGNLLNMTYKYKDYMEYAAKNMASDIYDSEQGEKPDYTFSSIVIAQDRIAIDEDMRLRAAYYNAYYDTDYDIDHLQEVLYPFLQNFYGDAELFRYSMAVIPWFNYNPLREMEWDEAEDEIYEFGKLVSAYMYCINGKVHNSYNEVPADTLNELARLYVSGDREILRRAILYHQLMGLTGQEGFSYQDGRIVCPEQTHINRLYVFVAMYNVRDEFEHAWNKWYHKELNSEDLQVEQMCDEYAEFCETGILNEDCLLEKIYASRDEDWIGVWESSAINLQRRSESEDNRYGYVKKYITEDGTWDVHELEESEGLSAEQYRLIKEACDSWYEIQFQKTE